MNCIYAALCTGVAHKANREKTVHIMPSPPLYPCLRNQLDLFAAQPVAIGPVKATYEVLFPTSNISAPSAPIEFVSAASSDNFTKLDETQLEIKASILTESGASPSESSVAAPVNNVLHSLFEQVEVYLGDTRVSSASLNYSYKAYIQTVTNFDAQEKDTHLSSQHFYRDNNLSTVTARPADQSERNDGLIKRCKACTRVDSFTMIGKPHCDIFNIRRLLLPGVSMRLRFIRSSQNFVMLHPTDKHKIVISSAKLKICRVAVSDAVSLATEKALDVRPAIYPMIRSDIKIFHVPLGSGHHNCENLFNGSVPRRIVLGVIGNAAYNGAINKNPYNFKHHNVKEIIVYVDGKPAVMNKLTMDYKNKQCAMAFMTLFFGRGGVGAANGNGLSVEDFRKGYALYSIDLTPTLEAGNTLTAFPPRTANIRVKLVFARNTTKVYNVVVLCESDATISIDQERNVTTDFSER